MSRSIAMFRAFLVSVFLCAFCALAAAQNGEAIKSYDVAITVETDGDIAVTETLTVTVEGVKIRRGIFRDLPNRLTDARGKNVPQKYEDVTVMRRGPNRAAFSREPVSTSTNGNAFQIRIGDADVFLHHGTHIYEISYVAKNQIRYFSNYDELYWNATGNFWDFPIEQARVTLTVPGHPELIQNAAYTGRGGQTGSDYRYSLDSNSHVFETTRPLAAREGLTVAIGFDKGVVDAPSAADKGWLWWAQNGPVAVFGLFITGLLGLFTKLWNKIGRDPMKGPIIPLYGAPSSYSAAACGFIHKQSQFKPEFMTATLVGLANKKHITIDIQEDTKSVLTCLLPPKDVSHLRLEEAKLKNWIFRDAGDQVVLDGKYNAEFYRAQLALARHLGKDYGKAYFKANAGPGIFGLFLCFPVFFIALMLNGGQPSGPIFLCLFVALALCGVFVYLMRAPTEKGQKVSTAIDGFKLYMETAEKGRLNATDILGNEPPLMSREHYEKMLPYAIALDVEKPWSKYFESVLPKEAKDYRPTGVSGNFDSGRSLSSATRAMTSTLSSGVASAAPASSSSSGSGGGGSSGGGGGGGGGGGW